MNWGNTHVWAFHHQLQRRRPLPPLYLTWHVTVSLSSFLSPLVGPLHSLFTCGLVCVVCAFFAGRRRQVVSPCCCVGISLFHAHTQPLHCDIVALFCPPSSPSFFLSSVFLSVCLSWDASFISLLCLLSRGFTRDYVCLASCSIIPTCAAWWPLCSSSSSNGNSMHAPCSGSQARGMES